MNRSIINGVEIKKGESYDDPLRMSQLTGFLSSSWDKPSRPCFHCNQIKGHQDFNSNTPAWTLRHPDEHIVYAKVFQTTFLFQRAFNVILGRHYTGNRVLEILRYGHVFSEYLKRKGYATRLEMNSGVKKWAGGKEHQHVWVVVMSNFEMFDQEFRTVNGYSTPVYNKPQMPIARRPYPQDTIIHIPYLATDETQPLTVDTNFINYVNHFYPGHNFTENTSYYIFQGDGPDENLLSY